MLVKIVSLFLIGMVVLAMFGRLKYPGRTAINNKKCPRCGRFRLGRGPCDCDERSS